jgi:hypothetical protein
MGFMDKAKKMAEQAQTKLDEAQKQFNSNQPQQQGGPVVEYDKHGRPIQPAPVTPDGGADAGPGRSHHAGLASEPSRHRAAQALQRGSARGLTLRECRACVRTKAC